MGLSYEDNGRACSSKEGVEKRSKKPAFQQSFITEQSQKAARLRIAID